MLKCDLARYWIPNSSFCSLLVIKTTRNMLCKYIPFTTDVNIETPVAETFKNRVTNHTYNIHICEVYVVGINGCIKHFLLLTPSNQLCGAELIMMYVYIHYPSSDEATCQPSSCWNSRCSLTSLSQGPLTMTLLQFSSPLWNCNTITHTVEALYFFLFLLPDYSKKESGVLNEVIRTNKNCKFYIWPEI